jgi:hypothetical protein
MLILFLVCGVLLATLKNEMNIIHQNMFFTW